MTVWWLISGPMMEWWGPATACYHAIASRFLDGRACSRSIPLSCTTAHILVLEPTIIWKTNKDTQLAFRSTVFFSFFFCPFQWHGQVSSRIQLLYHNLIGVTLWETDTHDMSFMEFRSNKMVPCGPDSLLRHMAMVHHGSFVSLMLIRMSCAALSSGFYLLAPPVQFIIRHFMYLSRVKFYYLWSIISY